MEAFIVESLIVTTVFWLIYTATPGAFWLALAEAARTTPLSGLFKQFAIFQFVGWGPQVVFITLFVGEIAALHHGVLTALYFAGSAVIAWLAYQTWTAVKKRQVFDFNWRKMALVSWSNPKPWVTIPAGSLGANYVEAIWLNAILFFAVSMPLLFGGLFMWGYLGKLGAKVGAGWFSYVTATLLAGYGVYLLIQGMMRIG